MLNVIKLFVQNFQLTDFKQFFIYIVAKSSTDFSNFSKSLNKIWMLPLNFCHLPKIFACGVTIPRETELCFSRFVTIFQL